MPPWPFRSGLRECGNQYFHGCVHGFILTIRRNFPQVPFESRTVGASLQDPMILETANKKFLRQDNPGNEIGVFVGHGESPRDSNIAYRSGFDKYNIAKGLTSFFRCTAAVFVNRIFRRSAQEILVELLGPGRSTTLPPSIHPKAGRPYAWATTRTLLDTTPDELPVLLPEDVLAIEKALSPWIEPPKPIRAPVRAISSTDLDEAQRRRQESYGLKILDEECRALAGMAKDSGRNRKVYDVACRVGRWVHHGLIQECHVVDAIVSACVANGLFAEDGRLSVIKSAHSGLSKSVNDQLPLLSSSCRGGTRHA